jgi:hypothetical protein
VSGGNVNLPVLLEVAQNWTAWPQPSVKTATS